jgi:hypothetical protein
MSDTLARSTREAQYIVRMAPQLDQRTGQLLFNNLRSEVAEACRGTVYDPFYEDLSLDEIIQWLEDHVIYNDQGIMTCFFIGNTILWEDAA